MKKHNLFSKATLYLVAISMSMFLFAGCQSNKNTASASQTTSNSTQSSSKPNAEQRKKQMQDSIQPLVTAKTITQDQANKILEALTTPVNGNGQNNQQNNNKNSSQNKMRNNGLTKLVSDGVITQTQADAVMQKIRGSFQHKNDGQHSQNSNQSSNQ
ncbi:hypothetical protein ACJDU8_19915 [Clostridium sp. WILCCON 0269]|uniref:Lipoprotein n=1 Tax=Candidatus Clostridium eludens TaxID=3381663 RepID=A0ABW8SRK6_9CLOT